MKVNVYTDIFTEDIERMIIHEHSTEFYLKELCLEIPDDLYARFRELEASENSIRKELESVKFKINQIIKNQKTPKDILLEKEYHQRVEKERIEIQKLRDIASRNQKLVGQYLTENYWDMEFHGSIKTLPLYLQHIPETQIMKAIIAHNRRIEYSNTPEAELKRKKRRIRKINGSVQKGLGI